jgi:hypothetical protein
MKNYIKQITWKFRDSSIEYPQLKERKVRVTSAKDIYDNFRICLTALIESDLLYTSMIERGLI